MTSLMFLKGISGSAMKKSCKSCEFFDKWFGVCFKGDSPYRGEFVYEEHDIEEFKCKFYKKETYEGDSDKRHGDA